jgi:hypothetical protein
LKIEQGMQTQDGVIITYKVGGQIRTINFTEDLDNFNNAFVDTLKGVVLDVDEFDWAVPGNGILIWHIDEKIANQENITANRVNIGENRGVDLEEADGIQDIGEEFQTIFGDIIIAEGEEFDFWYSSNPSRLYQNKFGVDTKPNTMTNNSANSLITFSNFSDISNEMSFDVSFGSENIKLFGKIKHLGSPQSFKLTTEIETFSVTVGNLIVNSSQFNIPNFTQNEIAVLEYNDTEVVVGAQGNLLNIAHFDNEITQHTVELRAESSSPIVLKQLNDSEIIIYVGKNDGSIANYKYNVSTKEAPLLVESVSYFTESVNQISILDNEIVASSGSTVKFENGSELAIESKVEQIILTKNNSGNYLAITLSEDNMINMLDEESVLGKIITGSNQNIESIALADLKQDGENYIVFNEGNIIKAVNLVGTIADNFPYQNEMVNKFVGNPLIADLNNDGFDDIISLSDNGNVYAISGNDGKLISGFPISVGGNISRLNTIVKRENDMVLSVTSSNNDVYFWSINSTGEVQWGSRYGDNSNSSSLSSAEDANLITTFFPKNKTYNWPNPVYGDETYIRTYVADDARVEVKIFDLAGDLVDEFQFNATGGLDAEYAWNVSNIQSGPYFAHLEVKSNNGKTESKIIKIAVIK